MQTRRGVLAVLGATVVAGCAGQTETTESTESDEESTNALSIPLGGLGKYEEHIRAVSLEDSEFSIEGMQSLLDQDESVDKERETLVNIVRPENKYTVLRAYYGAKENSDKTVVINQNYAFYQKTAPILELYTVEKGELKSAPVIKTQYGNIDYPGPKGPESIQDIRDPTDWGQMIPQNYKSIQKRIERSDDITKKDIRDYRAEMLQKWGLALTGIDQEQFLRPRDIESATTLYQSMYGDANGSILVDLAQRYNPSDYADGQVVEAEFVDGKWALTTSGDANMGDPLIGERKYL